MRLSKLQLYQFHTVPLPQALSVKSWNIQRLGGPCPYFLINLLVALPTMRATLQDTITEEVLLRDTYWREGIGGCHGDISLRGGKKVGCAHNSDGVCGGDRGDCVVVEV